jgi:type IV pilus assembly protein PilA
VHARRGFTLIELLIVVVIIGILAAIAIPKFVNTKEKAYIASMKSDLRNLVLAEETYYGDNVTYTTSASAVRFSVSQGVAITILGASGAGWSASASHTATSRTCAIFYGSATPPMTGQIEGVPQCN